MSFFRKIRHAFGFEDDTIFDIDDNTDETEACVPAITADAPVQPEESSNAVPGDVREAVFAHVVAVFNEALPEFLAKSVDPEVQKKVLYDKLDQGLKDYLARIGADADARCRSRWASEHDALRSEMEALRGKAEQVEHERADLKQRQLSADRQKRALSDRLKDLESQVANFEAEREQYELENKSLLNKLKVVAVQCPDVLDGAQLPPEAPTGPSQEQYDELEAENARMREALSLAAERQEMADAMAADLRKRLKVASQEVEDLQAITNEVKQVEKAIAERDATLARQRDNIRRLKEQIETLTDAGRAAEMRFAEREQELRTRLEAALAEVEALKAEMAQAAAVESVGAVAEDAVEFMPATKQKKPKKARREPVVESVAPKITDDDLSDVEAGFAGQDWFGIEPVEEAPKLSQTPADDDFGYHAPEPKPRPYDDGMQMSLFD